MTRRGPLGTGAPSKLTRLTIVSMYCAESYLAARDEAQREANLGAGHESCQLVR